MKKFLIGSVAAIIGLTIYGFDHYQSEKKPVKIVDAYLNEVADFSDDRILVGAAQNVFVGEVVQEVGSKRLDGTPETQYSVKVHKNLKGKLKGEVIVNQFGGYDKDSEGNNVLVLYNEDEMLKEGRQYMFATRYLESEDWHTAITNQGTVELKNAEEENTSVGKIVSALKSPIVPEAMKNKEKYNNRNKDDKSKLDKE